MAKKPRLGYRMSKSPDSQRSEMLLVDMESGSPIPGVQSIVTNNEVDPPIHTVTLILTNLPDYDAAQNEPEPQPAAKVEKAVNDGGTKAPSA